tara:strand:- start:166 stop:480 length:315 start_codon:yes stop_codon:yes gene_type:complete
MGNITRLTDKEGAVKSPLLFFFIIQKNQNQMDFEIEIISTEEYTRQYNKIPSKITKRTQPYVRLTHAQREQRIQDISYHRNWKESTSMPRAKSQRVADLNNRYQ